MPDMQHLLDNYSLSDIRRMKAAFCLRSPSDRRNCTPSILLARAPNLDALNHAR